MHEFITQSFNEQYRNISTDKQFEIEDPGSPTYYNVGDMGHKINSKLMHTKQW